MHNPATVENQQYVVTHVLNNNAVVVRSEAGISVFVGTGIGFAKKNGDTVTLDDAQQHYVAVEPEKLHYFNMLNSLSPDALHVIAGGVDKASQLLGPLHPSVYLLLTDHLMFAVERFRAGQIIHNNLIPEIRAVFPAEFAAAQQVLEHVNHHLSLDLPIDEAAFIALHLNAALSGESVKAPLSKANAVAGLTDRTLAQLKIDTYTRPNREALTAELVALLARFQAGRARHFHAHASIVQHMPNEWRQSERIMTALLCETMGEIPTLTTEQRLGETAFLAIFLHGWKQDVSARTHITHQGSLT